MLSNGLNKRRSAMLTFQPWKNVPCLLAKCDYAEIDAAVISFSDVLPYGRLSYVELNAISNVIG